MQAQLLGGSMPAASVLGGGSIIGGTELARAAAETIQPTQEAPVSTPVQLKQPAPNASTAPTELCSPTSCGPALCSTFG